MSSVPLLDKKQLMQAIYRDPHLTAQQKQQKMQELMKGQTLSSRSSDSNAPSVTSEGSQTTTGRPSLLDSGREPSGLDSNPNAPSVTSEASQTTTARPSLLDSGREPSGLDFLGIRRTQPATIAEEGGEEDDESYSKPDATSTPTQAAVPSGKMDVNARNRAIKEIYMDKSLSGLEKQKKIQQIMKGQTLRPSSRNLMAGAGELPAVAPAAPAPSSEPTPASNMDDAVVRNVAIKKVYMDKTLNGIEKQKKIQEIMKGQTLNPSSRNLMASSAPAPAAAIPPTDLNPPTSANVESPPSGPEILYAPAAMVDPDDDSSTTTPEEQRSAVLNPAPGSPFALPSEIVPPATLKPPPPASVPAPPAQLKAAPVENPAPAPVKPHPPPPVTLKPPPPTPVIPTEVEKPAAVVEEPAPVQENVMSPPPSPKRAPTSPPPTPPKGTAGASQRREIMALYKDPSLTALEKKGKMKEIIARAPPPLPLPLPSPTPSSSLPSTPERSEKSKTPSPSPTPSSSLPSTPERVEKSSKEEMESPTRPQPPPENNPAASRRSMIVAITKDRSLTAQEKQKKIQEIMKGGAVVGNSRGPEIQSEGSALSPAMQSTKVEATATTAGVAAAAAASADSSSSEEETEAPTLPQPPPENNPAASRRSMIVAITKDRSLTAQEKQKKIQEIMKGGAVVGNSRGPEIQSEGSAQHTEIEAEPEPAPAPAPPVNDEASKRRQAIVAVHKDRSLTPKEKQARIQEIMKGGSSAGNASGAPAPAPDEEVQSQSAAATAAPPEESGEDAASKQRKAIQAIYRDQSLTPQEKHKRVQALMASKSVAAPAPAPSAAPAAPAGDGAAAVAAASRNDSRSSSDSRSRSRSSGSRSDSRSRSNSGSYSSRSRSYSGSSRSRSSSGSSRSRSYSSRSGSDSRSYSGSGSDSRSFSGSSSYTGSDESSFSDEASRQSGMLIDADVAVAKPEDMRLFPTATTKPPDGFVDEDSSDSSYEDRGDPKRRLICCIVLVLVIFGGVGGPLLYFNWAEVSNWFDEIISGTRAPVPPSPSAPPTAAPIPDTSAPTALPTASPTVGSPYTKNTPNQCAQISRGEAVAGQELLESKTFDLRMDVSLTLQLSNLDEIVEEMESRLQEVLGPKIADCPTRRRLREEAGRRFLQIQKHVVANALFDSEYKPNQICDVEAPDPCIRVLTKLNLILKGSEDTLKLTTAITALFGEGDLVEILGLTAPFSKIELVGITATPPTLPPATQTPPPTPPPTTSTTPNPTKSPTKAPTTSPTQAPTKTSAPTGGRAGDVEAALKTLGDLNSLVEDAVEFLLEDDHWIPREWRPPTPQIWIQRYSLLVLFEKNYGYFWEDKDDWLDKADSVCTWYGVRCDRQDNVVKLDLNDNSVGGSLSTEIGLLTTLTHLDLANNELDGPIPTELGLLTNLKLLNLVDSDLKGTIPAELANIKAIERLNIDDNDLGGTFPTQFGQLEKLTSLSCSCNYIEGTIPTELAQCSKLTDLRFSDNRFTGNIPSEIFSLSLLKVIELDDNILTGTIPNQIGQLTAVTSLEFDTNRLIGTIPTLPPQLKGAKCRLEENNFQNVDAALAIGCHVKDD